MNWQSLHVNVMHIHQILSRGGPYDGALLTARSVFVVKWQRTAANFVGVDECVIRCTYFYAKILYYELSMVQVFTAFAIVAVFSLRSYTYVTPSLAS